MKAYLLFLGLLLSTAVTSQNILNTPVITTGAIDLGQNVVVQFNIDQETICDSYLFSTDIDYVSKLITITIDYTYVSTGFDSNLSFVEMIDEQVKLTGVYQVVIALNVPNKPEWNKMLFPGAVTVFDPGNSSCSNANIPSLDGFCPTYDNDACACNGWTYNNECVAYLEEMYGAYKLGTCGQVLAQQSTPYSCATFTSTEDNFLETYICSEEFFLGNELVLEYVHDEAVNSKLTFTSSSPDVCLFLIHEVNGVLACLVKSEMNILDLEGIPNDTYFVVVDKKSAGDISIEFCTSTDTEDIQSSTVKVYPNPARNHVYLSEVNEEVVSIELVNLRGQLMAKIQNPGPEVRIETNEFRGLHLLKLTHFNGSIQTSQIMIQN